MYLGKIVEIGPADDDLRAAGAPVHPGAAVGGAGARPAQGAAAQADRARGRRAEPGRTRRRAAGSAPGAGRRRTSAPRRSPRSIDRGQGHPSPATSPKSSTWCRRRKLSKPQTPSGGYGERGTCRATSGPNRPTSTRGAGSIRSPARPAAVGLRTGEIEVEAGDLIEVHRGRSDRSGRPNHFDARQNSRRRSLRPSTKMRPGTGKAGQPDDRRATATRAATSNCSPSSQRRRADGVVAVGPPIHPGR